MICRIFAERLLSGWKNKRDMKTANHKRSFEFLELELIKLIIKWEHFEQLFLGSTLRIELLMSVSAGFFYLTRESMLNDVIISMTRFSDPIFIGGKKNITIETLLSEVEEEGNTELFEELNEIFNNYKEAIKSVKEYRHTNFAHYGYEQNLSPKAYKLSAVTRQKIERSLQLLKEIFIIYRDKESHLATSYDNVNYSGNADNLIEHLAMAKRYLELQDADIIEFSDFEKSYFFKTRNG